MTIISVDNYNTYPSALLDLVHAHLSLFDEFTDFNCSNVAGSFDDYWTKKLKSGNASAGQFNEKFLEILNSCWIEGYHLSRTLSTQLFLDYGLRRLEWTWYSKYMDSVFSTLGYSVDKRKTCLEFLHGSYFSYENRGRALLLSLFAPSSDYILYSKDNGYLNLYATYIGGEIANRTDWGRNGAIIQNDLSSRGHPVLVKFVFPFSDITCDVCEYPQSFAANEILTILLQNVRGIKTDKILFLAQLKTSIPPENVKDIEILSLG